MGPRSFLSRLAELCLATALAVLLGGCGGGGGGPENLGPSWLGIDAAIKDIDGDGRADVVAVGQVSTSYADQRGQIFVYRQTGTGSFAAPDIYTVGGYLWRVVVADIDADGAPDLVVTDVGVTSTSGRTVVWLLLQDRLQRGRFLAPQQIVGGVESSAYEAAVADLNGDGAPDIAIGARNPNRLVIRYQSPAQRGTFLPPGDFMLPGTATKMVAGDLNGDGRADLLMWVYVAGGGTAPSSGVLAVSLQQPDGSLGTVTTMAPQTGLNVARVAIADFDGDGRRDLFALFTPQSTDYRNKLTLVRQGPAGIYLAPVDSTLQGMQPPDDAVVADFNGDGRPEVAVMALYPGSTILDIGTQIGVFAASGGGSLTLTALNAYKVGELMYGITAGDIDGDGRIDLLVLGDPNKCFVLIQSHTTPGTFEAPRPLR